jgi:hypothetical protein
MNIYVKRLLATACMFLVVIPRVLIDNWEIWSIGIVVVVLTIWAFIMAQEG